MTESGKLAVHGLSAGYGGKVVVDGVDLGPVAPGRIISLLGPNAAGKTTLLRALAGLQPAQGSVRLGDVELLGLPLADHAELVGYMPQNLPQRIGLSVIEATISALRASSSDHAGASVQRLAEAALETLDRVGIGHLAMRELGHLSGGQRQLASLAQALVRAPRVLLLDEPISALDLHYQLRVMKLVREIAEGSGMIVIMVLHDLAMAARWSDSVVLLSGGRVAAEGPPAEAITAERLAEVYQVSARVEPAGRGLNIAIDDILETPN
ncbi:ABC transporter ATP-binding protein [Pelagerythrobacter sp.]|uniref:ABC transporter ATP-binding protein n=1 Tax=Pelagerythrobacter sp. TaxID=2800702 RepID=UPI0035B34360